MARMNDDYTFISDRDIAGTGLGTSPLAVQAYSDLQRAVYEKQPADTADAQAAADNAQTSADVADGKAVDAQASADSAGTRADAAQARADDAYTLADGKVAKNVGPKFSAPTASPNRSALPAYTGTAAATYTQADVQKLMDQVAALTACVAALVTDGRGNQSLTNA